MNIPGYPVFRSIEKRDQAVFLEAFKRSPPELSEYTFTNLYSWRSGYDIAVSLLEGFIIVRAGQADRHRFFDPIGTGGRTAVMRRVLEDTHARFERLPESTAALFERDQRYDVHPDRDNADYLFRVSDLAGLAGRRYDGKRNLIRQFRSLHRYEYARLGHADRAECFRFEEEWCRRKACDQTEGLRLESIAVREMITHCEEFGLIGGAIRVEGTIAAIAIGQELNPSTLVMHALKAHASMPGLYQTINQEFLTHEAHAHEYVNFEQDLGLPGLRKAKLSYHPLRIIPKFTLSLRQGPINGA